MKPTLKPFPITDLVLEKFMQWQAMLFEVYGAALASPTLAWQEELSVNYEAEEGVILRLCQLRLHNEVQKEFTIDPMSINYAILFHDNDELKEGMQELEIMKGMGSMATLVKELDPFFRLYGKTVLRKGPIACTLRMEGAFAQLRGMLLDIDDLVMGAVEREETITESTRSLNHVMLRFVLREHVKQDPDKIPMVIRLRIYFPEI